MNAQRRLPELRVFIVEDESLIAMLLQNMIEDIGHICAFKASKLDKALVLAANESFDIAILDVNLNGESTYTIADCIMSRGLPVVFSTGYGLQGMSPTYRSLPILQKPFDVGSLRKAIDEAMRNHAK